MRKSAAIACALIWLTGFISHQASAGSAPDKIKFPYSPMSWNSLPWWMAKEAGHFERNGLDVDLLYEGASSVIVQAMLAGEANFAGLAGPSVVSNVISGGDVIQIAAVVKTFTVPMYSAPAIKEVGTIERTKSCRQPLRFNIPYCGAEYFSKGRRYRRDDLAVRRHAGIGGDADVRRGRRRHGAAAAEFDAQRERVQRARRRQAIPRVEYPGSRKRRRRAPWICRKKSEHRQTLYSRRVRRRYERSTTIKNWR